MKLIAFILALVAGAMSLVVFNRVKKEDVPVMPVLVANIGIPIDEVRKRSTAGVIGKGVYAGEAAGNARNWTFYREGDEFDWEVAGTGLRFPNCKYFRVQTGDHDDPRVVFMWVTTAQKKLTYAELKAEMLTIQERILADGWKPARYEDGRTADVSLRQELEAAKLGSDGNYGAVAHYAKGDVVMTFFGLQLYTDPLIVKDAMRQDIFYHRIELEPRSERTRKWGGDYFVQ